MSFEEEWLEFLEAKIDAAIDSMQMSISMEDYNEFFEMFGDVYCLLSKEYAEDDNDKFSGKIFDLIYSSLIPRSVELLQESGDL